MSFLKRYFSNHLFLLLIAAFLLRLLYFLFFYSQSPNGIWVPDSTEYWRLAENFLKHKIFSQETSEPFVPENVRTPLYPLFLSIFIWLNTSEFFIILSQILISTLTCFYTYKLSLLYVKEKEACLIALAIMALDIPSIIFSTIVLTETLFCLLLIISVYRFVKYFKETGRNKDLIISGGFLGLSMLCRPVSMFIPFIFIVLLLFYYRKRVAYFLKPAFILLFSIAIVISPWIYRNYKTFDRIFFSCGGSFTLVAWHAPNVYAQANNISVGDARFKLWTDWYYSYMGDSYNQPVDYYENISKKAKKIMLDHPYYTVKQQVRGTAGLLFKPVRRNIDVQIGYVKDYEPSPGSGKITNVKNVKDLYSKSSKFTFVLVGFQFLMMLIIYLGFLGGIILIFKRQKEFIWLILVLLILYLISTVVPPVTYSRFRIPVMPFIAVVAGVGVNWIYLKLKERKLIKN